MTSGVGTSGVGTSGVGTSGVGTSGVGTSGVGTSGVGTSDVGTGAGAALRAFVAEHAPGGAYPADWNRRLTEAGYVAPHWPRPWGLDASPAEQLEIDEAMRELRVPRPLNPIAIGWAGPTLLVAGTDEQRARWLPGVLDGSEIWCQLFSEPGAGSDLAGLSTRAVRDGDEYVVNGQKVWTTLAHVARFGILLARTDPDAEAHLGITYFVVDMQTPGIEVRPLVQMTGTHEFNEVFFTDVRIPAANVVGRENDGWRLAKVTLGNERVSLSGEGALWGRGPTATDVVDLVRAHGGTRDALLRQRVARLYAEAEVLRLIRLRTVSARVRGLEPGPEASVRKALADEHGQHVMALAKDLAGVYGLLSDRGPYGEPDATGWNYGYLYSRALTIGGGTSEVQRNIVAERVLGLPRDACDGAIALDDALRAWLTSDDHSLGDHARGDSDGWAGEPPLAQLHCHPDLVERLTAIARPVKGARRLWVTGCPVVHHRDGRPIACAAGTDILVVRSAQPAGALAPPWHTTGLGAGWVDLDPWAADITFAKAVELLRTHVRRAYDLAEAGAWP